MTTMRAMVLCACAVLAIAGCAARETRTADATTRAVYDDNLDAATGSFTPDLAKQVTRAQLGALSDLMHTKGDYRGITETGTEPDGAYDFRADFSNGTLTVKMKIDGDGRISGYRVLPTS